MSLHDDLFADAVEVLEDVAAVPQAGQYFRPGFAANENPLEFTAIVGAIDAGDEVIVGGDFDRQRKMEKLSLVITSRGIDWKLNGQVLLAGDPVKWQIERIESANGRVPKLFLKRQLTMEQGRAGRKQ